jgi:hypothetical protein
VLPLTDLGFTVIGFDGPGQGGALRQGIYFEHAWEKPTKAVLDCFELEAVDWLGASCGGYLDPRGRVRAADQAHHFAADDILGPGHDP